MSKSWESYEEVAADLLNRFAKEFGLDRVEGKQDVQGQRSGTNWEIDARGVRSSDGGFFIVECRRYTTSKQSQEKIGALAYRIIDSGASGGIMVSPLGLQEGAEKVASAEYIFNVRLNENSTRDQFTMQFLNKFMLGTSISLSITGHAEATVTKAPIEQADLQTGDSLVPIPTDVSRPMNEMLEFHEDRLEREAWSARARSARDEWAAKNPY